MLLTNPTHIAALEAQAQQVQQARAEFAAKRDAYRAVHCEIATHRKAADAAEAEAAQIRAETQGLLRQLAGQVTRPFRDMKAKERAAYTLADDFRALVDELEGEHETLAEESALLLQTARRQVRDLKGAYADALIKEGLEALPASLILGLRLKAAFRDGDDRWAFWRLSDEDSYQVTLNELQPLFKDALRRDEALPESIVSEALSAIEAEGIGPAPTPGQLHRRRAEKALEQATAQRNRTPQPLSAEAIGAAH